MSSTEVSAESSGALVLTLERAVELALDNSIDLQRRLIDLRGAEYAAKHLWAELFPGVSAGLGMSYGSELFAGEGFQGSTKNLNYTANLGLSLQLNSSLSPAMRIAALAYQTSLSDYENTRRLLAIEISGTFYSLIAEREKLSLLEGTRALADLQLEKNRAAFRNGLVKELDYIQSQLSVETARLNLRKAEAAYGDNLGKFLVLLGLEPAADLTLEGELRITWFEADSEALIRQYLPSRPDIISRRQEIERLVLVERQRGSGRVPSLSLGAQWQGGSSTAGGGVTGDFSDRVSGSLTVNIPLDGWIPGTKTSQSIRTANADIEKARLSLRATENQAMHSIRSLVTNLRNSWGSIELAELSMRLAERSYELAEEGFRNGAVEFLVLEDNRNNMTEARQRLLDDRLAYKKMMLELSSA
ncbi:MAG: TolC family protein, partial [Treponema sp.]|nr:TolC family protein [Treponema sp.]